MRTLIQKLEVLTEKNNLKEYLKEYLPDLIAKLEIITDNQQNQKN